MNETSTTSGLFNGYSGTVSNLYSSTGDYNLRTTTTSTPGNGLTLQGNSTINYPNNLGQSTAVTPIKNMTPKQVNVAVFTITRDKDTNEINSTKFFKELWIEQKNGTSIDLLVAKQLGNLDFDPESTIIKVLSTVSF